MTKILVINPGSTSTRLALFENNTKIIDHYAECNAESLAKFHSILEQTPYRKQQVLDFLETHKIVLKDLTAIAARGAPLRPLTGGVYLINSTMLADVQSDHFVDHISKTACLIADELAKTVNIPCYTADHISTDELESIARITGLPAIKRRTLTHALNMKAVARLFARNNNRNYNEMNLITAHLGGGFSMAAHKNGQMIDTLDANGQGSFSPERCGGFRSDEFAKWLLAQGRPFAELKKVLTREAGLFAHLGTKDGREIEKRINNGDAYAQEVYTAMAYNIAKDICALSAAVCGQVDGIILTGGLANSKMLTQMIINRVSFIAEVTIIAGEREMEALNEAVLRVVLGEEKPRIYPSGELMT